MPVWLERVLVVAVAVLLLGAAWWLRAPLHNLPLERDEGAYATIGARWLAGEVPYRDVFDHKPPLLYLVYALARLLPGNSVHQIRVLATAYLLAGGLALLALGWRLYGRWAGLVALALYLAYGSSLRFQGLIFNSEAVLVLPATLGCLLAVGGMRRRSTVLLGAAGVCVGLALAAKPVGAALLIPLALGALNSHSARPGLASQVSDGPRMRATLGAAALAGVVLVPLLFALVLWRQGALPATYEALVVYNRLYAQESVGQGWDPTFLWRIWAPMLALALPAAIGLAATLVRRELRTPAHIVAALWGLALLATAVLSLRAYPHYYLAAVPFFSLWAGAGIAVLGGKPSGRTTEDSSHQDTKAPRYRKTLYSNFVSSRLGGETNGLVQPLTRLARVLAALGVLAALVAVPIREIWPLRAQTPYEQIGTLYGPEGYAFFGHADEVAAYIAEHVPAEQPIFVWAAEPEIYYLTGRRPAARFIYDYPVEHIPGARDQLLLALRQTTPPLIITYHDVRPIGFDPFMPDYGYELSATIGGYDVFERPER
jgi:hypothetical protein